MGSLRDGLRADGGAAPEQRASAAPSSSESPLSATARRGARPVAGARGAGAGASSAGVVVRRRREHVFHVVVEPVVL